MNTEKYFMGVDTGTQSVRVIVTDIKGTVIAGDEKVYETFYPQAGWAEQKPADWWNCFNEAVKNVMSSLSKEIRHNIQAVSVCSTSSTVIPVDEQGNPLTDAIMWMDTRAKKEMKVINDTKHPVLEYSGGEDSVEWMIPKVLWIKNNQKDIYAKSYKIIEQLDWMNYQLCGVYATSICNSTCKWNYIECEGGWNGEFFKQVGLEDYAQKLVLDVKHVGEFVGTISREFADHYDINPEMKVVQGGIDAHIGMLGLGVAKEGKLAMIMGTSFVQLAFSEKKLNLNGIWGPYNNAIVPDQWLLEGGQISAGSIIKWFMREFDMSAHENPYAYMNELVAKIPAGSEGLVALDFFQGNRTPYKDANAKGVIYGLTLSHTKAHIYRALLESVALGTKNIIDNFEAQGCPINIIVGCGGVTKDTTWMQIIADVTGKPIVVTEDASASVLGCAIVAAVGSGTYESFDAATKGMVKEAYSVQPNKDLYATYQGVFDTYTEIYENLKDTMAK
ncbi:MAG: carbohydrate kinase [Firmicutes bacterium]|nr:FGGY-family carbohydrate kinase [uncultured Acetobacterium sp.]MBU4438311.1 carbohydrate kinase [Bacillota bacterium]